MFRILIIKVPRGEAPLWVREAWLGMTFECAGVSHSAAGVLSNEVVDHGQQGYQVSQAKACKALAAVQPNAAAWWNDHGYPSPGGKFVFYRDEVLVLTQDEKQNSWG